MVRDEISFNNAPMQQRQRINVMRNRLFSHLEIVDSQAKGHSPGEGV